MRPNLTSLVLLAAVSIPAGAQVTTTIQRDPIARTTFTRIAMLSPVSPATARKGQQNVTVQLTGMGTHFAKEITTLNMGPGITVVGPLNVTSPTSASAVVNIDAGTAVGARAATVTTGSEVVSLTEAFTVVEPPDYFGHACGIATPLGTLSPGMMKTASGWIDVAGSEDWLTVSVPAATILRLTLTGAGAGSEIEMSAIPGSCGMSSISSTTSGTTPKQIMLAPANSPQTFVIRVYASHWKADTSRFTLTLSAQPLP